MSLSRSLARRPLRLPAFVALGVLGFLSMAAKGCNGEGNVSLDDEHVGNGSPAEDDSSFDKPMIVTRDNPMLSGVLEIGAGTSGVSLGTYGTRGRWTNLTGTVDFLVHEPDGHRDHTLRGPLFPGQRKEGPTLIRWMSRSGDLVPHNKYETTLSVMEGKQGAATARKSDRPLWIQLADDVAVVPVVVISWKKNKGNHSFNVNESARAKALFDFAPVVTSYPTGFAQPDVSVISKPNDPAENIITPDAVEIPPDDLYADCKVQFQVVATYEWEIPSGENKNCDAAAASFASASAIRERLRASGPRGAEIADRLQPIYVSYGSFRECFTAQGYHGKKVSGEPLVEISAVGWRPRTITAHELGHVLMGPDHFGPMNDSNKNLMREMPNDGAVELTPAQCSSAHASAQAFRDRFVEFNHRRGIARLKLSRQPPVLDPTMPEWVKNKLCCASDGAFEPTTSLACRMKKGTVVPDSNCEVCCLDGDDVKRMFNDQCSVDDRYPNDYCDPVCCSDTGPHVSRTRLSCKETGTEIACNPS